MPRVPCPVGMAPSIQAGGALATRGRHEPLQPRHGSPRRGRDPRLHVPAPECPAKATSAMLPTRPVRRLVRWSAGTASNVSAANAGDSHVVRWSCIAVSSDVFRLLLRWASRTGPSWPPIPPCRRRGQHERPGGRCRRHQRRIGRLLDAHPGRLNIHKAGLQLAKDHAELVVQSVKFVRDTLGQGSGRWCFAALGRRQWTGCSSSSRATQ